MKHKELYKKDSNENIRVWWIESEGEKFRMHSGVYGGQIVVSEWTTCEPKNIGKKNATTGEEQCLLEVEASYKKKLAQGNYKESLDKESLEQDNYIKPMLAKEYGEDWNPTDLDFKSEKIYSNVKYDGLRTIATINGLYSRQGKKIISAPHILRELKPIFDIYPNIVLDGELYSDKLSDNFNEIISLARKTKPEPDDFIKSEKFLQYWIYDIESMKEKEDVFSKRYEFINSLFEIKDIQNNKWIKKVIATKIKDQNHLDRMFQEAMEQGYEGQIIRINSKPYENKRTKQLIKRKEFKEEEFKIVDIVEGEGNRSGMAGNILVEMSDGKKFGSGIQGDREFYRKLLKEKDSYIGTQVSIKYQNLTPDGIPRFPVAVKFWNSKTREF